MLYIGAVIMYFIIPIEDTGLAAPKSQYIISHVQNYVLQ